MINRQSIKRRRECGILTAVRVCRTRFHDTRRLEGQQQFGQVLFEGLDARL